MSVFGPLPFVNPRDTAQREARADLDTRMMAWLMAHKSLTSAEILLCHAEWLASWMGGLVSAERRREGSA